MQNSVDPDVSVYRNNSNQAPAKTGGHFCLNGFCNGLLGQGDIVQSFRFTCAPHSLHVIIIEALAI